MTIDIQASGEISVLHMKVNRYIKLLKLAKYTPITVLAISILLSRNLIGTTGVKIPPGEDPSIF